jgi:hypothetical protein
MQDERLGATVIDAYLLVLLAKKPTEPLESTLRTIELDPIACRKHFAWPENGDSPELQWFRVLRVTSLGLPSSSAAGGMTGSPVLESELQLRILDDIRTYRGGRQAAREHADNPSIAPSE